MVFDGEKIKAVFPNQIQHHKGVNHELAQLIAGMELFLKTFKQSLCFSRPHLMLQEQTTRFREPSQLRTYIFE